MLAGAALAPRHQGGGDRLGGVNGGDFIGH